MPLYVDGFLVPVPKRKLEAYRRMAQKAGRIWAPTRRRGVPAVGVRGLATMMDPKSMAFDVKRMAYGGFKVVVDL